MIPNKIKYGLKEYFSHSKSEKVGILVLISLIIIGLATSIFVSNMSLGRSELDISMYNKEISDFEKSTDSVGSNHMDSTNNYKTVDYKNKSKRVVKEPSKTRIDLNLADTTALEQLPGIGPVFAKRILKYRALLGGYYSVNQLKEVYGIKPEVIDKFKNQLYVDTNRISKINLNMADFKEINAHPYISFEQTKAIFKYKKANKINSMKQLQELNIFTAEELFKLRPYLLFVN